MSKRQAFIAAVTLYFAGLAVALVGVARAVNHQSLGGALCGTGLALVALASWISGRGKKPETTESPSRKRDTSHAEPRPPTDLSSHDRALGGASPSTPRRSTAGASRP